MKRITSLKIILLTFVICTQSLAAKDPVTLFLDAGKQNELVLPISVEHLEAVRIYNNSGTLSIAIGSDTSVKIRAQFNNPWQTPARVGFVEDRPGVYEVAIAHPAVFDPQVFMPPGQKILQADDLHRISRDDYRVKRLSDGSFSVANLWVGSYMSIDTSVGSLKKLRIDVVVEVPKAYAKLFSLSTAKRYECGSKTFQAE